MLDSSIRFASKSINAFPIFLEAGLRLNLTQKVNSYWSFKQLLKPLTADRYLKLYESSLLQTAKFEK
jgi:hypothetical protein